MLGLLGWCSHMPGPWSQGWRTVLPFPSLPWEPVWVAHWERVPLAVAPEPGVSIGGCTELSLCGPRCAGAHIRALFAEVKGVFVSFWRRDRGRNNFPHSSLIPPFE